MSYLPPHMRNRATTDSSSNARVVIPPSDPSVLTDTTRANIGFWSKFDRESLNGIGKKIRKPRTTKQIDPKEAEKEEYDRYVRTVQDEIDRASSEPDTNDVNDMAVDEDDW
jgi:hypothetical protein